MQQTICIIGTDTGIGKTYITCQILQHLAQNNYIAAGLKPIASGISSTESGMLNEDVYSLYLASNLKLKSNQINPFLFNDAIAPHIAANKEKIYLNVKAVTNKLKIILNTLKADFLLIEGVGGLLVPLNINETYLDLLIEWNFPIILIIGMRLGCLNHALLTYQVLINNDVNLVGWVANSIDPHMECYEENLEFLIQKLNVPLLATNKYLENIVPTDSFKRMFI